MRPPRFLDGATALENHERFLRRAVEHEKVWTLANEGHVLFAESTADDEDEDKEDDAAAEPRAVYLFFSDEAYAKRALREAWPDVPSAFAKEISLVDLLFRWLPGMHQDGHLAGGNWTGDLIGLEVEPADLQSQLRDLLSPETRDRYQALLASAKA
jgi:hypothetical protein